MKRPHLSYLMLSFDAAKTDTAKQQENTPPPQKNLFFGGGAGRLCQNFQNKSHQKRGAKLNWIPSMYFKNCNMFGIKI